jgi:membrane-associated phospholipid phosphatase
MSRDTFPHWKFGLLLCVIAILMVVVYRLPQLDLIVWLQRKASSKRISFLQFISDSITFISLGVPLLLALWMAKQDEKKKSVHLFLYAGLSIAIAGLISYIIKNIGSVPRPFEVDTRIFKWSVGGGFSFPSGHTTEAFAAATALTFLFPKWRVAVPAFCWASLVAFSRVFLGVHYPFDILGGIAIGTASSYVLHFFFRAKTNLFTSTE